MSAEVKLLRNLFIQYSCNKVHDLIPVSESRYRTEVSDNSRLLYIKSSISDHPHTSLISSKSSIHLMIE